MVDVEVTNRQSGHAIDDESLRAAVAAVLEGEGLSSANISLAIVDTEEIWRLNREFLRHDYPTDVLSFVLEQRADHLEGEIVCCADTAAEMAPHYDWTPAEELLLYAIHGALHLTGQDDAEPTSARRMRELEELYLRKLSGRSSPGMVGQGTTPSSSRRNPAWAPRMEREARP